MKTRLLAPALLVLHSPDRSAAADQVLRLERTSPRPDVAAAFPRLPAAAAPVPVLPFAVICRPSNLMRW